MGPDDTESQEKDAGPAPKRLKRGFCRRPQLLDNPRPGSLTYAYLKARAKQSNSEQTIPASITPASDQRAPHRPPHRECNIREVLCSGVAAWGGKVLHELYSKYQWALSRFLTDDHQNPSSLFRELAEDTRRELERLIHEIEDFLYELNSQVAGTIQGPNQAEAPIKWKPEPAKTTLLGHIKRACDVYPINFHITLRLIEGKGPILDLTIRHRVENLEKLLSLHQFPTDMIGWSLELPPETDGLLAPSKIGNAETHLDIDETGQVDSKDLERDGKWRGVVKLRLYLENRKHAPYDGTGWLVDENTIATAAHNVHSYTLGHLISVEIFFAPELEDSETRLGTHVVVHAGWYKYKHGFSERYDIAFIRLNSPPTDTPVLRYLDTPCYSTLQELAVRGYPAVTEPSFRMHVASYDLSHDLNTAGGFLEYILDTGRGNTGSPVFCNGYVIGTHRGRGTTNGKYYDINGRLLEKVNQAVIIDQGLNNPKNFIRVLKYLATQRLDADISLAISRVPGKDMQYMRYTVTPNKWSR
ncbi:hypothetical protein ABW21_db0205448 [Orbilia brochopaga]|nr:hypothetical protein ABW21_db0205448 [Drechslerella brochopaga]